MNILILDDDPFFARTTAVQLQRVAGERGLPVTIHQAHRADEAVERLWAELEDIGLVICDLQMPEMDGVEFVRLLSRMGYRGGLALVSGEDRRILHTAQQMADSLHLDILGAFQKPIPAVELAQLLDQHHPRAQPAALAERPALYLPSDLRRAIDNGELVNHYQPKVDMRTGALVGAEALVRWAHPRNGLVMPGAFIPMAEASGLVGVVGEWVTRQALRDMRDWEGEGRVVEVAVNVALGSLVAVDFPDQLAGLVREAGIPGSRLMLEITESRLMENPQAELDVLARLRLKGFRLSIDDFGTGYSGLDRLRSLPFNELKIDRSFVHGVSRDATSRAIVHASLTAARELGLKAVAEGVEDLQDWRCMGAAGCELAQGYFIGRPMPAAAFLEWARQWERDDMGLFA